MPDRHIDHSPEELPEVESVVSHSISSTDDDRSDDDRSDDDSVHHSSCPPYHHHHDDDSSDAESHQDGTGDGDAKKAKKKAKTRNTMVRRASVVERMAVDGAPLSLIPTVEESSGSNALNIRKTASCSSSCIRSAVPVPRSQRHGLLAQLCLVKQVTCPYDYPTRTKWLITAFIAIAGSAGPIGTSIAFPALGQIAEDLSTSPTLANLSISMYMLAMAIFPLWWAVFSEAWGRRTVYISSFVMFVVFSVLCALSVNVAMLVTMRTFSGGASAAVLSVGAGTLADIWEVKQRGRAMGFFYLGPLVGPLTAPVAGGALAQKWGWRATFWFLVIYGGVVLVSLILGLPETLRTAPHQQSKKQKASEPCDLESATKKTTPPPPPPTEAVQASSTATDATTTPVRLSRTTTRESVKQNSKRAARWVKEYFLDPLRVLLLLRYPAIVTMVVFSSLYFGILYVINVSITTMFPLAPYHFDTVSVGLMYIPMTIGNVVSSIGSGRWVDHIMNRKAVKAQRYNAKGKLQYLPEDRFGENMWVAVLLAPCALLLYGWLLAYRVHWAALSVGLLLFGLCAMMIFSVATTALTEYVPKRSASAVAVNNFARNMVSCIGSAVAHDWLLAVGPGWVFTTCAIVTLVIGVAGILVLKKMGNKWRVKMDETI